MIELSSHAKLNGEVSRREVREDLETATAIMTYAIRKNLGGFQFSGLRIPSIIQTWEPSRQLPDVESFATEVATFQEHLHERIVALAYNRKMIRTMWNLNEKTRHFREYELRKPEAARDILDRTAALVNALFNRDEELCSTILLQCAERRYRLLVDSPDTSNGENPREAAPYQAITTHHNLAG
ncbi:FCD domain-containing protein [Rhizobium sp. BT-175]|uniref:FCD domain-containing protein n=1 Tax=Rhizobium sp. BT-175 TaxID=2986929 RepID=UPI0022358356|nr:FCD domain-containing protein [Rhizobium sp. BT-175]MCV9947465.1 FCD domain-containing protein [Rhizobium sp. BT-175]